MAENTTTQLQALLELLQGGNQDARLLLLERAHARIRRLAGKVLNGSFGRLQRQHDLDSVVSDTWMRLLKALESVQPATVKDFFRLTAHKIRHVLLDMVEKQRRIESNQIGLGTSVELSDGLGEEDPSLLAQWTEFHQKVASLAADERDVFEQYYYVGLSQAEIAQIMDLPPRQVSRLWLSATAKLAEGVIPEKDL